MCFELPLSRFAGIYAEVQHGEMNVMFINVNWHEL